VGRDWGKNRNECKERGYEAIVSLCCYLGSVAWAWAWAWDHVNIRQTCQSRRLSYLSPLASWVATQARVTVIGVHRLSLPVPELRFPRKHLNHET
jgi:hypothetical protein